MSREILQDIISDFSPDKFTRFFRAKNRSFSPHQEPFSQYNDPAFADGMKFGEIQFSPDEKLIVCAFKAVQPLSERSSRKAQYEKGKTILKDTHSDAGIFIFYDSRGNFRFSLIYPQYIGRKRQWNNFRRFTYFANAELTNKTFLARVGDGDFSSLEKVKDAFSVEKVAKEFYEQYRKLFEALVVDLNSNQTFRNEASRGRINTHDFAKKLLGQIVFLYFLQKKGWLGVPQNKPWGEGDKNFISNLYRKAVTNKENFFNDYLEILFYDTLNNAHRESADPSFSRYFNCRIPFLNGGLFEPEYDWHGTKIYLENGVFKNIFEVFDRYNFTVEEESPDDKEVAVDPEMLGKVFENLLEENLRKGKGTYYTPREIVHYMCRESLVNYLVSQSGFEEEKVRGLILRHESGFSTDEGKTLEQFLKDVKICDPACGSGAFLVGMLTEIVSARLVLDPAGSEYGLKKETIQNCIYGVDIDPGAVEIAKLRLWLSLVVDYELADIEPLPNLDYKIMCGNSLLEELIVGDESISLFDPGVLGKDKPKRKSSDKLMQMDFLKQDAEEYLKILRKLHVEYFHETDTQKKKVVRGRIEKIEMDFIQSSINKRVKELDERIRNLNMQKPEDRKKNAGLMKKKLEYLAIPNDILRAKVRPYFLWHLNFFEVFQEKGGFDVVIANPPYIDSENMVNGQGDVREAIQRTYQMTRGNWDIYIAFFELGFKNMNTRGTLTFITPDKWISKPFGDELRKRTIGNIFSILKAGRKIFDAAKVDSIVSFFSKQYCKNIKVFNFEGGQFVLKREVDKDSLSPPFAFDHLFSDSLNFLFRIENLQNKIADFCKCENACATSDAYKLEPLIKNFTENKFNPNKYLKIINTGTIEKYYMRWGKREMTYLKHKYLHPVVDRKYFLDLFRNSYGNKSLQPKIIMKGLNLLDACLDQEGIVIPGKTTLIITHNDVKKLKLLLAILNSKLAFFYIKERYPASSYNQGTTFTKDMINNLPMPQLSKTEQEQLARIVEKIFSVTSLDDYYENREKQTKVREYEHQIDQIIYKLYGLAEEEIRIVEGDSRSQSAGEPVKKRLVKAGSV